MSTEDQPSQTDINQTLAKNLQDMQQHQNGLTKQLNEIGEFLRQKQTAGEQQKEPQKDPSDQPLTLRNFLQLVSENIPNILQTYKQIQAPPQDPNAPMYLELGREMFRTTSEELYKKVFAKQVAKDQAQILKTTTGIQ